MEFEIFLFMIWRRTENPFETEFASNGSHPISNVKNNELLQIWVDCKFKNKRRKNKSRTFDVTKCDDSILHIAEKRFWCLFVCVTWNYAIKMSHNDFENFVRQFTRKLCESNKSALGLVCTWTRSKSYLFHESRTRCEPTLSSVSACQCTVKSDKMAVIARYYSDNCQHLISKIYIHNDKY